ncbi:hypothetical protein ACFWVJ_00250 [Streptomyces sp. NPDC058629]
MDDIVWSRALPEGATPSIVTVSQDPAGRWLVSMLCDDVPAPMPGGQSATKQKTPRREP